MVFLHDADVAQLERTRQISGELACLTGVEEQLFPSSTCRLSSVVEQSFRKR